MKVRIFLSLACLAALLTACGHGSKQQQAAQVQPARTAQAQPAQAQPAPPSQLADATPLPEQPDLPESQPLDQNGQPVSQPAPAPRAPSPHPHSAQAKPSPVRTAPVVLEPPPSIDIPAGTVVRVRLQQTVSTKRSRPGDRFHAILIFPVIAQGQTVIPRGTVFDGHILEAKQSGRFKGRAVLRLALDSFWLHGVRHPLGTAPDTAVSHAGETIGALITGHKNVTFQSETPLTFRLRYDVAVAAPRQQS